MERGAYDEALAILSEAEPVLRASLPGNHELAVALNSLGTAHTAEGSLDLALRYFEEALEIDRAHYGDDHAETATTEANIGSILGRQGRPLEAEPRLRRSLETLRRVHGDGHPRAISAMNTLGQVLRDLGRAEDALSITREALELARRHLGSHMVHAQSAANLASLLDDTGQSVDLYREALRVAEGLDVEPSALPLLQIKANLAYVLHRRSEFAEAAPLFDETLPAFDKLLGSPKVIADYLAGVAITFISVGRPADAEAPARRARALRREHEVKDGVHFLLAAALALQEKDAEAEPLLREALSRMDGGHWTYHWIRSLLGSSLAGQGKFEEAEPLLVEGYRALEPPPDLAMHKPDVLERVVRLYEAWGNEEKAQEWRSQRAR
jgi:tetratricopeptide (TPR) repeat protein